MRYNENIFEAYKNSFKRDKKYIQDWVVRWKYIDVHQPRQKFYQHKNLYTYNGIKDLENWFAYYSTVEKVSFYPNELTDPLCDLSINKDKEIFEKLNLKYNWENYKKYIGVDNSHDFIIPHSYPVPERREIKKVLDFGPGLGRQANLWTQKTPNITYVGMEAIPNSYCVQHAYYSHLGVNFNEYIGNENSFKIKNDSKGIYHLPTWRRDLLPDNSFDLVICLQVLSEINGKLAKEMIKTFHRILKPGGALYVRDPGPQRHKSGNKVNVDEFIDNNGFCLEFRPYVLDNVDIHSFPRIWRKKDSKIEASKKEELSLFKELNYLSGGVIKRITNKIKS